MTLNMLHSDCEKLDPRIRRTRGLLQNALRHLLESKQFEDISVQDITDAATLNRATFYAHYPDKFALLEESVRVSFLQLLQKRHVRFDGTCPSAFRAIVLAVCDYLADGRGAGASKQRHFEAFLQGTVIDQLRLVLLDGFARHAVEQPKPAAMSEGNKDGKPTRPISPETIAAAASWAIYGAVKQWVDSAEVDRLPQEEFVGVTVELVQPILMAGSTAPTGAHQSERTT
jgi:AcrR family transcriptional regulator